MLANLTMDLIFTHVDSESTPIDTPLMRCLTRCFFSIISKVLLNSSTEHLVRASRMYIAASIVRLFTSDSQTLQTRNFIVNLAMFSPTVLEGSS